MKIARAGLTMVTFLSWMVNARTSFFIGRALVGNRIGLTLRSVGSNSMFPLVLCLRQGWHAVCPRVRRVDCPLQGCPGSGGSRQPGASRFCRDLEVAPLSLGVCPGGPSVRESARLHAKLECAGETDLSHVVSENFSKPGNLLEAGRPRCVPLCGQRVGAKFCELELQNAPVQMHGDPLRGRRGSGRRTGSSSLLMKKPSSSTLSRSQARCCSSACGARAEAGRHDSIESFFDRCADPVTRLRRVTSVMHHNLGVVTTCTLHCTEFTVCTLACHCHAW